MQKPASPIVAQVRFLDALLAARRAVQSRSPEQLKRDHAECTRVLDALPRGRRWDTLAEMLRRLEAGTASPDDLALLKGAPLDLLRVLLAARDTSADVETRPR